MYRNDPAWQEKFIMDPEEKATRIKGHPIVRGNSKWQPDKAAPFCKMCFVPFTLRTRKHHCRLCGLVYCNLCTSHKIPFETPSKEGHWCRACLTCSTDFVYRKEGRQMLTVHYHCGERLFPLGRNLNFDAEEKHLCGCLRQMFARRRIHMRSLPPLPPEIVSEIEYQEQHCFGFQSFK
jgi:hypothetical protein